MALFAPKTSKKGSKWTEIDSLAQKNGLRPMVYWPDGNKYQGQWKNNLREGKGTMFYNNGDKYQGEWLEDYCHGKGMLWRVDGREYKLAYNGEWQKGNRHGKGIYYDNDGNKYVGYWLNDKRHGKGWQQYEDTSIYEGDFYEDKRQGEGREIKANGDVYVGSWKDNMKNGEGVMKFYRIMKVYKGIWANDVAKCGEYAALSEKAPKWLLAKRSSTEQGELEETPDIPELGLQDISSVLQQARKNVWTAILENM